MPQPPSIDEDTARLLLQDVRDGLSIADAARKYEVSENAARKLCRKHGVMSWYTSGRSVRTGHPWRRHWDRRAIIRSAHHRYKRMRGYDS